METTATTLSELRNRLEAEQIDLHSGNTMGYVDINDEINLNAAAIGLGLSNIEFEPEQVQALIFRPNEIETTAVLIQTGIIAVVDASNDDSVQHTISAALQGLQDLNLIDVQIEVAQEINQSGEFPVPSDL